MTSIIRALPTDVIHLIAAGEVIDSLAAVVRELAENALDAGATRISISIWTDQWRVRVADNGSGMSLPDLQQAAMPHSTSKIRESHDLWQIMSLGFRGEALHSLAQLAELEICSRSAEEEGWCVRYDTQGSPIQTETIAIAPGTIVTVANLFGNWLPRRQGLPTPAQQLRWIQLSIQQLALCHPQITWQIEQNDRPWFAIWAGSSAKQLLPQFVRDVQASDLHELTLPYPHRNHSEGIPPSPASITPSQITPIPQPSLYLLLGLPDRYHRHRPDWIKTAVNGRMVRVPELEQTILGAFRRTLPRDRYPLCLVHLRVAPDQVDWNRHPAKAELYLHDLEHWKETVLNAIAQALQSAHLPDSAHAPRIGQVIKAAEAEGMYHTRRTIQPIDSIADRATGDQPISDESADSSDHNVPSSQGSASATAHPLMPLQAVGQVHSMYILAEHPTGIWLVEQHIAHERVLYEQLCDRWHLTPMEPPIILSQLSENQLEQLQRLGITVEPFGEQLWAVRTVPELLASRDDCPDALIELSLGGDLESALVSTACRTAIRNGTVLSLEEMQTLLDQWQQTRQPRTCPHGRPIYLPLEESSLSRFFRRHWVIGKSHGI
jgi:DNA mismatch repair protein MutL